MPDVARQRICLPSPAWHMGELAKSAGSPPYLPRELLAQRADVVQIERHHGIVKG